MRPRIHSQKTLIAVAMVLTMTMLGGCMWAPDLAMVKRDIERQMPGVNFNKKIELSLGPLTLGFVRLITSLVPDAREASPFLRDVRRVQVAVYELDDESGGSYDVKMPARIRSMTEDEGWELAVKVREEDESVWVMYKMDDESIREAYVCVLGDEELVLVHAKGRLERLMARALHEAGGHTGIPHISEEQLNADIHRSAPQN